MTTQFFLIKDAVAEIEMLTYEGYTSFKLYKHNGMWQIEAK